MSIAPTATELFAPVRTPDAQAAQQASQRQLRLTKPTGALGRLEELSIWWAAVAGGHPPRAPEQVSLVVFAGDHGAASSAGTSAYPAEVTPQMVGNMCAGGAAVNVLARQHGVAVRVVDVSVAADYPALGLPVPPEVYASRVMAGGRPIDRGSAASVEEIDTALRLGAAIADTEADAGADLLIAGDMGIGNSTAAAALVTALTGTVGSELVGRGTGIDDPTLARKRAVVRAAVDRLPESAGPVEILAEVAGADLAAMTGFLARAAVRGVPVLLDGIVSNACALAAQRLAPGAREWWIAGHRSTEPAAVAALAALGLEPILDLRMRLGEGSGALTALPVLRSAALTLREMATFDSAGVSDGPG